MEAKTRGETLLIWILRLLGFGGLLAAFCVLLPMDWMAAVHERLGLGEFPRAPIVEYMARSLSAFYAMTGGLFFVLSFGVRQHRTVLCYLAWAVTVFGIAVLVMDIVAGLPWYWTCAEGPPTVIFGVLMLSGVHGVRDA